jgi:hypothetical protein
VYQIPSGQFNFKGGPSEHFVWPPSENYIINWYSYLVMNLV